MFVQEAVTVQELWHDVGLEGHVERRACLLTLKQVRVVAHLHKQNIIVANCAGVTTHPVLSICGELKTNGAIKWLPPTFLNCMTRFMSEEVVLWACWAVPMEDCSRSSMEILFLRA